MSYERRVCFKGLGDGRVKVSEVKIYEEDDNEEMKQYKHTEVTEYVVRWKHPSFSVNELFDKYSVTVKVRGEELLLYLSTHPGKEYSIQEKDSIITVMDEISQELYKVFVSGKYIARITDENSTTNTIGDVSQSTTCEHAIGPFVTISSV